MQIYDLLKQDHVELKTMLRELVSLKDNDEYRYVLIQEIKNALIPHSRAEEAVFYNSIRSVDADKAVVTHGYKEHLEAESLLTMLQVKDKSNLDWKKTAEKLKEVLEHHIDEEEDRIFKEARKFFSDHEASVLGDAFVRMKPNFAGGSSVKNTVDQVLNMLPPRLVDGMRNLGEEKRGDR